ncbi:hypothetical protein OF83DRAFT_1176286 [Amylostereum chailletii]|nr:hypothetical protein OF83DRAFT_1176286 [Amylostereum chailletii]
MKHTKHVSEKASHHKYGSAEKHMREKIPLDVYKRNWPGDIGVTLWWLDDAYWGTGIATAPLSVSAKDNVTAPTPAAHPQLLPTMDDRAQQTKCTVSVGCGSSAAIADLIAPTAEAVGCSPTYGDRRATSTHLCGPSTCPVEDLSAITDSTTISNASFAGGTNFKCDD